MSLKITILGCGNSSGVPSVGNFWGACNPVEPKNRRTRCALLVESATTTLLVDTGADLRAQANAHNIQNVSAVLYTHHHSDHVNGIDDLRGYFYRGGKVPLPVYGSDETFKDLTRRFDYLFEGGNHEFFYPPIVKAHRFAQEDYGRPQHIGDIDFVPFLVDHGTCTAVGYRFGDFGYTVDMKTLDAAAIACLKGVKIWVADAAAYHNPDNAVHANLDTVYAYNDLIGAAEVYISSLSTLMDYETLKQELKPGFFPAYDGLSFEAQGFEI